MSSDNTHGYQPADDQADEPPQVPDFTAAGTPTVHVPEALLANGGFLPPLARQAAAAASAPHLSVPLEPGAVRIEVAADPEPVLSFGDVETIVGDLINNARDRGYAATQLNQLTRYIAYLQRLRCGECGSSLGYSNFRGHTLCGSCANGETPAPLAVNEERNLAAMAPVPTLNGGTVQVQDSGDGEYDAVWLTLRNAVIEDGERHGAKTAARGTLDIRDALQVARDIMALAQRCGYIITTMPEPELIPYRDSDDVEEEDDGIPEEHRSPVDPRAVAVPGRYGIDADGAEWVSRWAAERQYTETLTAELSRVGHLHGPYVDEDGVLRCRGCIAGYDPRTGNLTNCKWPCPTDRARKGES